MTIEITVIPHLQQRYDTVGDWYYDLDGNKLIIKVSSLDNWRYEALVAVHELLEAILCSHEGITAEQVDAWDFKHKGDPGEDPKAPYHQQHLFASVIEEILCHKMNIHWPDYERVVDSLVWREPKQLALALKEASDGNERPKARTAVAARS